MRSLSDVSVIPSETVTHRRRFLTGSAEVTDYESRGGDGLGTPVDCGSLAHPDDFEAFTGPRRDPDGTHVGGRFAGVLPFEGGEAADRHGFEHRPEAVVALVVVDLQRVRCRHDPDVEGRDHL